MTFVTDIETIQNRESEDFETKYVGDKTIAVYTTYILRHIWQDLNSRSHDLWDHTLNPATDDDTSYINDNIVTLVFI